MKNLIRKLTMKMRGLLMLKGKKRYIALTILAMELASLPAAAQIVNKVVFQVRPTVSAVEIPTPEAGLSRFLVVSNAPFTIRSANMVGDLDISVHQSGEMNGRRFGDNAQMPGPKTNCASVTHPAETVIYAADRKTAATPGTTLSQAVIIQIAYDSSVTPNISFAKDNAKPAGVAAGCISAVS